MWRFKTKEELIKTLGKDWRDSIQAGYVNDFENLWGIIPDKRNQEIIDSIMDDRSNLSMRFDPIINKRWSYSYDMFIKIKSRQLEFNFFM